MTGEKKRARNLKSSYIHFAIRYGGISIALYDVRFPLAALPLAKKQAKIRWKCNFGNLHYLPQGLLLYYFYQIFLELYSQNENKQLTLKKAFSTILSIHSPLWSRHYYPFSMDFLQKSFMDSALIMPISAYSAIFLAAAVVFITCNSWILYFMNVL